MSAIRSVAILFHKRHPNPRRVMYRIWQMAESWRAAGIRVDIVKGPATAIDADFLIPQVDLSVVPDEYREVVARHPRAINSRVTDVRKRSFSPYLVSPGDGYDGPVMIKTDRNCGGGPEWRTFGPTMREGDRIRDLRKLWTLWLRPSLLPGGGPLAKARALRTDSYPVFASPRDVPPEVFDNDDLVVQRFLPEKEGDLYVTRTWTFFGDRERKTKWFSTNPCVKGAARRREDFDVVPDSIKDARRRIGLDFAKLDFVIHDGEAVLLDVNPTPTLVSKPSDAQRRNSRYLAEGIEWFA